MPHNFERGEASDRGMASRLYQKLEEEMQGLHVIVLRLGAIRRST